MAALGKLNTAVPANAVNVPNPKSKTTVVDSWEDDLPSDDDGDNSSRGDSGSQPRAQPTTRNPITNSLTSPSAPAPPPPTPASPHSTFPSWNAIDAAVDHSVPPLPPSTSDETRRQQKSTAVASRLIAAGIGIRPPKRTDEQKAYDRAAKEQEMRRREREKEEAEKLKKENESAKNAVWDM